MILWGRAPHTLDVRQVAYNRYGVPSPVSSIDFCKSSEPFTIASDQDNGAVLGLLQRAVARPMPEVGPVMMYALRSDGLLVEKCVVIVLPVLRV